MNIQLNILKIIATVIVYMCHCLIVCNQVFGVELASNWQILLKTPAWGGVWIFVFVSGYLAEKGFNEGKFELTKKGIKNIIKDVS